MNPVARPAVKPARKYAPDGRANGYRFQDAIGAELLLATFHDSDVKLTFETKLHADDKFDDLIKESDGETIRFQCKNGPDFTPTNDLWRSGGNRGIKWADLCKSVETHLLDSEKKQRFILLTSFKAPDNLEMEWSRSGVLQTMAGRKYKCYVRQSPLDDEPREIISQLEVVFGAEHHNAEEETDLAGIKESPWWAAALECVPEVTSAIDNPHLAQPDKTLIAALYAASEFRAARKKHATCDDVAEGMHIAAGSFQLQQTTPDEEFVVIKSRWINDVNAYIHQSGSHTWLVGPPGCGKSTAIQYLSDKEEPITYRLFHPDDSPEDVRNRLNPVIFRHELAGILDRHYPELMPQGLKADSSLRSIKKRLDAIASMFSEGKQGPLVIFDGLDHDFRDGNQGRLVGNLMDIQFPPSFRILVLSRPLQGIAQLQGFNQLSVFPWNGQDINDWLNANDQSGDDQLITKLETASGGSPLILSMMLRLARSSEELNLECVATCYGDANGVLDDFLSKLLSETRPAVHDALAILVVHTYPMKRDMLEALIGLPSVAVDVFTGHGLQSICKKADAKIELPHAYLGQFIKQQAKFDEDWESRLHAARQRLLHFCMEHFENAALHGDVLSRLLNEHEEIREIVCRIGPETLVQWASTGVHEETARDALQIMFQLGAKVHDPRIMMRMAILADRVPNLFKIENDAVQRLLYFTAIGDTNAGERLARQIIEKEDRNGMDAADSILQAMYYLHEHCLENQMMDDVEALHIELRGPNGRGGLSWEQILTAKARLDSIPSFWKFAERAIEAYKGSLGIKMIILKVAPRDSDGLVIGPDVPPNWLLSNSVDAIRIGAWLLPSLPSNWFKPIRDAAAHHNPTSLTERFAVAMLVPSRRAEMADFKPEQLTIPHYDPYTEEPQYADAFYLGAIASWAGEDMEQIYSRLVGNVGKDGTARHMVLAALGAWLAKPNDTQGVKVVNEELSSLAKYRVRSITTRIRDFDYSAKASFEYMSSVLGVIELANILQTDSNMYKILSNLSFTIEKTLRLQGDDEYISQAISAKRDELLAMEPDEVGPCRELIDLAIEAAELGHLKLAKQCFTDGLVRGFRYGYRKDIFLLDVWEALIEIDSDISQELGLAIQLLNWSRHLQTVTDGKETRWFEGQILEKFLDLHLTDLQTAREIAISQHTAHTLIEWSINNMTHHNRDEWEAMLDTVMELSRGWEDTKSSKLVRLAQQAFERDEGDIGRRLLREAVDSFRPEYDFDDDDLKRFEDLSTLHDPTLIGRIKLKEDRHIRNSWSPKSSIGEEVKAGCLAEILNESSEDELEKGFQDLWTSRDDQVQNWGIDVIRKLFEHDLERGWRAAEQALRETSKMSKYWGSGFRRLCEFLIEFDAERTLREALYAWRNDSIHGRPYGGGVLPNMCWLIRQVRGREASLTVLRDAVEILSRSLEPHQHRVQVWGSIQKSWMI